MEKIEEPSEKLLKKSSNYLINKFHPWSKSKSDNGAIEIVEKIDKWR